MKQRLFFVFFSLIQCFYLFAMQLDVVKVGPANCTIFKMGNRALIYDCGYSTGKWMYHGNFTTEKSALFTNIMKNIEEVGIVISHDDVDHKNLLPAIDDFLGEKIKFKINITNQSDLPVDDLCKLQMFFGSNFRVYPIIPDFRSDTIRITTNDKSLILKIAGVTREGEGYSFLMTGDATKKTFDKITAGEVISWNNPSIEDNNKYWNAGITNLFTDVVCFMPAHHGADTEDSLIWSVNVLQNSIYPVLTIISSDPLVRNQSPTLQTICYLNDWIVSNLQKTENYKKYFCVPHDIDCYYEAFSIVDDSLKFAEDSDLRVIKYPSFHKGLIVPMFVTSNSQSGIYTISLNHDLSVTLFDNTVQLYGMRHDVDCRLLSGVCTAYMRCYAFKKQQEAYHLFDLLQKGVVTFIGDDFGNFVANQKAVIKNTKILSYLTKIITLLDTVMKETANPFADIQDGSELLDTVPPQASPQQILFVLFNCYFRHSIELPNNMIVTAAVNSLRTQYQEMNDDNFCHFLTSIGVANEKEPYQEFLYSKIAQQ